MSNPNWSEFITATLRDRRKDIAINILGNRILTHWFTKNGKSKSIDGGASILENLAYGETSNITWFDGYDTVSTAFTPRVTAAEYYWAWGSVPITIAYTDQWKNRGKHAIFDILKEREMLAAITFRNQLNEKMFTAAGSAKEMQGLPDFIEAAAVGSQTGVVGGIDKAANTYWNNQYRDVASSFSTLGRQQMENLYMDCSTGTLHPDLIVGTRSLWQNYHRLFYEKGNWEHSGVPAKLADTQFKALEFWGTPVVWDDDCPADTCYFLTTGSMNGTLAGIDNTDMGKTSNSELGYLKLINHKEVNFMITEAEKPHAQFAYVSYILHGGSLSCSNMSLQGLLDNVDTWATPAP